MKLGKNTAKYAIGVLGGGPLGALKVASDLQDARKRHKRKKERKATPTTRNYNIKTNNKGFLSLSFSFLSFSNDV